MPAPPRAAALRCAAPPPPPRAAIAGRRGAASRLLCAVRPGPVRPGPRGHGAGMARAADTFLLHRLVWHNRHQALDSALRSGTVRAGCGGGAGTAPGTARRGGCGRQRYRDREERGAPAVRVILGREGK